MSEALIGGAVVELNAESKTDRNDVSIIIVGGIEGGGQVVADLLARSHIASAFVPNLESACSCLVRGGRWVVVVTVSSPAVVQIEVLQQIARCNSSAQVVFINHRADPEVAAQLLRAGAFHVLSGPELHPEELVRTIHSAVHHTAPTSSGEGWGLNGSVDDSEFSRLPYRDAKEQALEAFEARYFRSLLSRTGGNVSEAARQAGLDRSNFRRALRRAKLRASSNNIVAPSSDSDTDSREEQGTDSEIPGSYQSQTRPLARAQGNTLRTRGELVDSGSDPQEIRSAPRKWASGG